VKIANELSLHFVSSRCLFLDAALPMARFVYSSNSCPKRYPTFYYFVTHEQLSGYLFRRRYSYTEAKGYALSMV